MLTGTNIKEWAIRTVQNKLTKQKACEVKKISEI